MKRYPQLSIVARQLSSAMLVFSSMLSLPSLAASVALVNEPMATTTATNAKPNIMFILDNSTSMGRDYLPDWATGAADNIQSNSTYNGLYYDPATYYAPPVNYMVDGTLDTTTYPSMAGKVAPWTVKNDAYVGATTTNLVSSSTLVGMSNASYYITIPGEYCDAINLKNCIESSGPTGAYTFPAPLRWCDSTTEADKASPTTSGHCQAIRTGSFTRARYPKGKTATITVSGATTTATQITSITVGAGGPQILSAPTALSTSHAALAANIRDNINACAAAITGSCTVSGYSAVLTNLSPAGSGTTSATITITANGPYAAGSPSALQVFKNAAGTMTISSPNAFADTGSNSVPGSIRYIDIIPANTYPYPGSSAKAMSRTDCAGTVCTYAEEMANFANWFTYYRTRMQAMKTSVSRAFNVKAVDSTFRVGFSTISNTGVTDGTSFLGNKTFELAYKQKWFDTLFKIPVTTSPIVYTPLRGALSKAGRYYARKVAGQTQAQDPVQYSCQQNFTILSTDGYWNANNENASYGPFKLDGTTSVGDQDGGSTPLPMHEGSAGSNSLADVAKYYYDTDLRDGTAPLSNCIGGSSTDFPTGNPNVCENNVFHTISDPQVQQHMTTFTMGLGADGLLNFQTDYETAAAGDFYNLKNGAGGVVWPDPVADTATAIDDLWHAAVNGHGTYFSAKKPDEIVAGFSNALGEIRKKRGSAAAAATSTLTPTSADNKAFVASYTTSKWIGNLESRSIDINSGLVSKTATWCVENIKKDDCLSPSTVSAPVFSGASTVYYCVTPVPSSADCPASDIFDSAASTCSKQIANECTGRLPLQVGAFSDTRNIFTSVGGVKTDFTSANFGGNANFAAAHVNGLNQWATISSQHTGSKLVNYLRGQTGYEDRPDNLSANRLYRARTATMGDALESQPAYIAAPTFAYTYPGYGAFKSISRPGTVYVGANDGMLHAFDGTTGDERWAYIPSMVLPNLWKLASTDYASNHINLVNGSPIISDIFCTSCAGGSWRTILVAGLNGGGRGYYALDITDPLNPALLWEFKAGSTAPDDPDLGYTFGRPVVTRKKSDGTWVVLVTSGYDNGTYSATPVSPATSPATFVPNSPSGNGLGYLYVLNASTGALISKIATTGGTPATPSGLAQIAVWNNDPLGNEAGAVYGGDLLGQVWRFDIDAGTSTLFAQLPASQPVTTAPALGIVTGNHIVYIGTGKYLEKSDLTTTGIQSLYAIKDDGSAVGNPRSHLGPTDKMVPQTIVQNGGIRTETISAGGRNNVDFSTDRGWYVDFPDSGTGSERVNINMQLVAGTLAVPTLVPDSSACAPGGYGWMNYFDYATGWPVGSSNDNVSKRYDSSIVGVNFIFLNGEPKAEIITADNPDPELDPAAPFDPKTSKFRGRRSVWREL